jgi:hypothetical protein
MLIDVASTVGVRGFTTKGLPLFAVHVKSTESHTVNQVLYVFAPDADRAVIDVERQTLGVPCEIQSVSLVVKKRFD